MFVTNIYTFINIKQQIHIYIYKYKSFCKEFSFLIFIFINQNIRLYFVNSH